MRHAWPAMMLWFVNLNITNNITVGLTGVPLNVLLACAIGAWCSFSFADKVEPRGRMYGLFLTCVFMGAAFTVVVNAALSHFVQMVMTDPLQVAVGTIVAFTTRFLLPWIVDVLKTGKWVEWIPFIRSTKQ